MNKLSIKEIILKISAALFFGALLATNIVYADCSDDILPSTPNSRFTVNNNGTVTDNQTGLMWMRCSLGQTWGGEKCEGSATNYTWRQALVSSDKSNLAGFNDWYLPNIKELASIIEISCYHPAINNTLFPSTQSRVYWTSSHSASSSYFAWGVYFGYGFVTPNDKNFEQLVRLVRVAF